jgi:hypothetical protein
MKTVSRESPCRAECVQSSVVGTLCNELEVIVIVARSDLHSDLFVQQGGIEAVTAAMSAYIAFSEIQVWRTLGV